MVGVAACGLEGPTTKSQPFGVPGLVMTPFPPQEREEAESVRIQLTLAGVFEQVLLLLLHLGTPSKQPRLFPF